MEDQWASKQFEQRLVEPNSVLGKAITYLQRHWEPLTLFLRQPGAPIDNNAALTSTPASSTKSIPSNT